jgi:hypothetical protein
MKSHTLLIFFVSALSSFGGSGEPQMAATSTNLAPLPLKLPAPSYFSRPVEILVGPHIEPRSDRPRPPFLAPVGVTNLALHKKVTASRTIPFSGELAQITDGEKEANERTVVQLGSGSQWVQIDLGAPRRIHAIVIWQDERQHAVFQCVNVQIADDADFTNNVRTLFNNDYDNLLDLGAGVDKEYYDTFEGKLVPAKGATARYVRCHCRGNHLNPCNSYTEIEIWGLTGR